MNQEFATDLIKGLSSDPKCLYSKYFYDKRGSELFQEIMNLEEYYLTRCEFEILSTYKHDLLEIFQSDAPQFELIEFGAGDGLKTKILLEYFLKQSSRFKYIPIDISSAALKGLLEDLSKTLPKLQVEGVCDDYFKALKKLKLDSSVHKVVLFMGSNIGNFTPEQAQRFLVAIQENLNPGDLLMIGFDLKKNPHIVLNAYNDKKGITCEFNLNLLRRINREMGADFEIKNFCHYPIYDPASGAAKSYLMSTVKQKVHVEKLDFTVEFEAWEAIHTETSHKYTPYMINRMAEEAGFERLTNFYDQRNYFTDSVWRVI
ncbi:MAG: L-histidine N(alpha)-methyltransferase [Microscillaceae bacterium]|nr:L-histidine N(alpha)-methyltransferase [Microscillaceae bacterium]